jgi:hypothetical protein
LYEGQFVMTNATTSSVWRSTGGDSTRTASAGSMVMAAPFYVANAAATANITASSTSNSAVILPANAVVTSIAITETGAGNVNLGFTPLVGVGPGQTTTLGTPVPTGLLNGGSIAARTAFFTGTSGAGASVGNVANATNLVVITCASNGNATGDCSGVISYFVSTNESEDV